MKIEDFFKEFLKTGIGKDFYKTTVEFLITESYMKKGKDNCDILYFDYIIGLTHHGKKYEIIQKNQITGKTLKDIENDFSINEVENFSRRTSEARRSYFRYKKELRLSEDPIEEIANMFKYVEYDKSQIFTLPNDIIMENFIIFSEPRSYFDEELQGMFFSYDGSVSITEQMYLNEFVRSLDDILLSDKKLGNDKKIIDDKEI